jgi:hypothetical protein
MRLTLLPMMKLVAGFAFASAYVLPFVRLAEAGIATWSAMLSVAAIGIPLVFALTTAVLARPGDFKDWLLRLLGMVSVGVALGVSAYGLFTAVSVWIRRGAPTDPHSLAVMLVLHLPVVALGFLFIVLLPGVAPARWGGGRAASIGTSHRVNLTTADPECARHYPGEQGKRVQ